MTVLATRHLELEIALAAMYSVLRGRRLTSQPFQHIEIGADGSTRSFVLLLTMEVLYFSDTSALKLVCEAGFEPATYGFRARHSSQTELLTDW